jgi:hypothetical protein
LQQDRAVVFEAAIAFGNFFVRVDILVKDGDRYELIEVKAKSYDSTRPDIAGSRVPIKSGMRPYIEDVAFQAWVMRQAYPGTQISTFLMMPDKSVKATQALLRYCELDTLAMVMVVQGWQREVGQ